MPIVIIQEEFLCRPFPATDLLTHSHTTPKSSKTKKKKRRLHLETPVLALECPLGKDGPKEQKKQFLTWQTSYDADTAGACVDTHTAVVGV